MYVFLFGTICMLNAFVEFSLKSDVRFGLFVEKHWVYNKEMVDIWLSTQNKVVSRIYTLESFKLRNEF